MEQELIVSSAETFSEKEQEIVDFLTTVMKGNTPVFDIDRHPEHLLEPNFVTGMMEPIVFMPKMEHRIKAAGELMKIRGMVIKQIETNIQLIDEYFSEADTILDKLK